MVINCLDGRTQIPAVEWMRKTYWVEFVDTINGDGRDKILAENSGGAW